MLLLISLLLHLLTSAEEKIEESSDTEGKQMWIDFVIYAVVSYVISLRGNKGFLHDLEGLNENWKRNSKSYFIIVLLENMK